ncbi:hypothetical protein X566_15350 [Afipia sp. P52-10]|uniref:hypothetical protein n=1 Tax=Afipia sp. P52-10 TaxID=1429916 RepID=UPI0003DF1961|nr:hypothetical protein [Afipia sp. P52-10]ETR79156.1 hypothetical protein X566_15350 [Afipia sp. P52-10]
MPELTHLIPRRPDRRTYNHGVKRVIPELGFGVEMDRILKFAQKQGIEYKTIGMARRSPEYLKALVFLFPEEEIARAWVAEFGGEYVGIVPPGRSYKGA